MCPFVPPSVDQAWPGSRRTRQRFRTLPLAGLLLAAVLAAGCSDHTTGGDADEPGTNKRMSASRGEYTKGYQDGARDAKWSISDADLASWSWIWMMEEEYRQGYKQGWADGRRQVKLEDKKKQGDGSAAGRTSRVHLAAAPRNRTHTSLAVPPKATGLNRPASGHDQPVGRGR